MSCCKGILICVLLFFFLHDTSCTSRIHATHDRASRTSTYVTLFAQERPVTINHVTRLLFERLIAFILLTMYNKKMFAHKSTNVWCALDYNYVVLVIFTRILLHYPTMLVLLFLLLC